MRQLLSWGRGDRLNGSGQVAEEEWSTKRGEEVEQECSSFMLSEALLLSAKIVLVRQHGGTVS